MYWRALKDFQGLRICQVPCLRVPILGKDSVVCRLASVTVAIMRRRCEEELRGGYRTTVSGFQAIGVECRVMPILILQSPFSR